MYQVKWSKDAVKNPLTWLQNTVTAESDKIKARAKAGATRYVLMTSVSGTAAAATGPNGYGAGTIDKLDTMLAGYAADYGLDSMECWWRDDLDALVPTLPHSVLWRFQKMLAGPEAMRFLLEADQAELVTTKLALLVRKAGGAQLSQDIKVKFKQAELDNDDLEDLFVDVKAHVPVTLAADRTTVSAWSISDPKAVGAAEYLVSSDKPFTLVRGEPGQGKSTLGQYPSQVYRSEFIPDEPRREDETPRPEAPLLPGAAADRQPDDSIRLIFHVFKALKDAEADAVKNLVTALLAEYRSVEFAFVHVGDEHDWSLFDTTAPGIGEWRMPSGLRLPRGKGVPRRGHAVLISPTEILLSVTGAFDLKQPVQGLPQPLLLRLHKASTFADIEYLAGQAFRFTALSWRRFYPSSMPVTILYSDLIASLLGRLRHVRNWNADIISTTFRTSRWFL